MATILAATSNGLVTVHPNGGSPRRELEGRSVGALAPETWDHLWAAVDGREIWRTKDGGWERIASLDDLSGSDDLEVTCLADTRANPLGGILAGTTRARLVRVTEERGMEFVDSFDRAPGREEWYTPWGGPPATRTISEDRAQVYVNVHVGGVLRSRDEGATWEATIEIDADVHQVATGAGRVYAAGGSGLSVSYDAGNTWRHQADGLHATYCRAVAVCGSVVLVSASNGPRGGRAAVYLTDLDSERFERCREGLPAWFSGNIDSLCLDALPDGGLAALGTESGELYVSTDRGQRWALAAKGLGRINRVLTLP